MIEKRDYFVVLRSLNGQYDWEPVPVIDVPAWVTAEDNMQRMVDGEKAYREIEGEIPYWWRVEKAKLPPNFVPAERPDTQQ